MRASAENWYKLDNAAKIYPAVLSKNNPGTFRVAVTLREEVEPSRLQEALERTILRYPSMAVTMKSGLFWYFFDQNNRVPTIEEEYSRPCSRVKAKDHDGYHFKVYYYGKRIALEIFHALTDGTGGMEFLKSLVCAYLELGGVVINEDGNVRLWNSEGCEEEEEDSFKRYYDKGIRKLKRPEDVKAKCFIGEILDQEGSSVRHGIIDGDLIRKAAKFNGVTVTVYMASLYLYAIYLERKALKGDTPYIVLMIPVNLRKIFPSESLRNFTYFVNIRIDSRDRQDFEKILSSVRDQLTVGIRRDKLYSQIHNNVKMESMLFFRLLPNVLKNQVLKQGRKILGENTMTSTLSNLGVVRLPEGLEAYIENFEFVLNNAKPNLITMSLATYGKKMIMTMSRGIDRTEVVDRVFELAGALIDTEMAVYSNEEDVNLNEILAVDYKEVAAG